MGRRKVLPSSVSEITHRPAETPEERENQLIALAYNEAERRIASGTASSQEICHFLKLGSSKARLEQEKLKRETEMLAAKADAIKSAERIEELYSKAIDAMRQYSGHGSDGDEDEEF